MNESARNHPVGASQRLLSVDILRGVVMLTMVFVNDIAGRAHVPWWMEHYKPYDASGMTFVDVVFPAFLFIVGMAIPLAIESRRSRGERWWITLGHILLRTISLLIIGVMMVKAPDAKGMGWTPHLWQMLMFLSAILAYISLPVRSPAGRLTNQIIRAIGLIGIALLAWVFRDSSGNHIRPEWWGILGLIGWAYLVSSTCYLLLRWSHEGLIAAMVLMLCLFFADNHGAFDGWRIRNYIDIGSQIGSHSSITLAGVILGSLLLPSSQATRPVTRVRFALLFGVAMAIGAILLHKTYGVNKNAATPSWCLWSSAITCWLWAILYLVVDVARFRWWAILFAWAGTNALLLYLLHPLWSHLTQVADVQFYAMLGKDSLAGVIERAVGMGIVLSLIVGLLGRIGVRLKL